MNSQNKLENQDEVKAGLLINAMWAWEQTQYSDGQWIGDKDQKHYTLIFSDKNKITGKVSCNTMKADYLFSNLVLNIEKIVVATKKCKEENLDAAFINDLGRVINFEIEKNHLVLQLENNASLMYFEKQ